MKKILVYLCILLTIASNSFAWQGLRGQPVVYNAVITGLRISAVDGTAFIDGANSTVTDLADGEHMIEVFDASGNMLRGWLGAVGTGEGTLGSELVTNGTFDADESWNKAAGWSISGGVASNSGGTGYLSQADILDHFAVYKVSADISRTSGSLTLYMVTGAPFFGYRTINSSVAGIYRTAVPDGAAISRSLGFYSILYVGSVDNVSCVQVLTPSASGATIVSAKSGATANFSHKATGFVYNAASYRVIIKKPR